MTDLVKRLRIKAGMIEMGERIAWGSDSALMREAAGALEMAAPAVQGEPVAWMPYLSDRADGVTGHYAIARKNPAGYREVWNLRHHHWAAFSDEVLTMDEALAILKKLEMPTAPITQPAEQQQQPEQHDTKGSRKALGAMNAKLRAKVGRLERELAAFPAQQSAPAVTQLVEALETLLAVRVVEADVGYGLACAKAEQAIAAYRKGVEQ